MTDPPPNPADLVAKIDRLITVVEAKGERIADLERRLAKPADAHLTAKQAAEYLGIAYGTFRKIATQIPRTKNGRYRREDLDKYSRRKK